jgi:hypothetical protein
MLCLVNCDYLLSAEWTGRVVSADDERLLVCGSLVAAPIFHARLNLLRSEALESTANHYEHSVIRLSSPITSYDRISSSACATLSPNAD